jgi:phage terminase large subunit-like protein
VLPPEAGERYIATLDVGLTNDRTVLVVAHAERYEDGEVVVVVDRVDVWAGTKAKPVSLEVVLDAAAEVCRTYRARLRYDPHQAQHLAERLRTMGVRTEQYNFTQASVGRLAVTLYRLLRDHLVEIPNDPDLIDELVNVQLRETSPGAYRIDHASGRHDDRVIALAMAAHALVDTPLKRRRTIVVPEEEHPDAAYDGMQEYLRS